MSYKTYKTVFDANEEARRRYDTKNNCFADFPVGTRVKIICLCQDNYFFYGETGTVDTNSGQYLGIRVSFDEPRHYDDGYIQKDFGFNPDDLAIIEVCDEYSRNITRNEYRMEAV